MLVNFQAGTLGVSAIFCNFANHYQVSIIMKLLHTSDWHLGSTLYGYERAEDHAAMLRSLCKITRRHRPDAIVVSGDIFDNGTPSAASQTMLASALMELREAAGPQSAIVLTAGNHDSPSRHETHTDVYARLGITTIGTLSRVEQENPEKAIIPIAGVGWVAAVPYLHPRNMEPSLYRDLTNRIEEQNSERLPVVVMAHTAVAGSDFSGHATADDKVIGGIETVEAGIFGSGFDYLALGHIHRPQTFSVGSAMARYCGTPIHVSFDEKHLPSVTLVNIAEHGLPPRLESIPTDCGAKLVTVGGEHGNEPQEALDMLDSELKSGRIAPGDFVRLNVLHTPGSTLVPAEISHAARTLCAKAGARFCVVNAIRHEDITTSLHARKMSLQDIREISPVILAREYARGIGADWTESMENQLTEAIDHITLSDREP